jgi:hypothetical protein
MPRCAASAQVALVARRALQVGIVAAAAAASGCSAAGLRCGTVCMCDSVSLTGSWMRAPADTCIHIPMPTLIMTSKDLNRSLYYNVLSTPRLCVEAAQQVVCAITQRDTGCACGCLQQCHQDACRLSYCHNTVLYSAVASRLHCCNMAVLYSAVAHLCTSGDSSAECHMPGSATIAKPPGQCAPGGQLSQVRAAGLSLNPQGTPSRHQAQVSPHQQCSCALAGSY